MPGSAANMPAEVGGAGLDTVSWVLYEKELGKANFALHWNCVGRPSNILNLCRRAAPALSPALRQRREIRLPGDDRAGRRLRHPQHEDLGGPRRLRFHHQWGQAFHQPCRCCRFRDPVRSVGRGGDPARQEEAHHRLPDRQGNAGIPGASGLLQCLASRLQQCDSRIRRLPRAGEPGARRGSPGLRGGQ